MLTARQMREQNRERQRRFYRRLKERVARAEAEVAQLKADVVAWRLTGERMVREGRMTESEFHAIVGGAQALTESMALEAADALKASGVPVVESSGVPS